jgi:hypothetical protein
MVPEGDFPARRYYPSQITSSQDENDNEWVLLNRRGRLDDKERRAGDIYYPPRDRSNSEINDHPFVLNASTNFFQTTTIATRDVSQLP